MSDDAPYVLSLSTNERIYPNNIRVLQATADDDRVVVRLVNGLEHVVKGTFEELAVFWGR